MHIRSGPPGAESLLPGLRQLFQGDLPPEGGGFVCTLLQIRKVQRRVGAGVLRAPAALMSLEAGGRIVVQPV